MIIGLRADARAAEDELVVAVMEIIADGEDKAALAGRRLHELAEATGLECCYVPNTPAVAIGNQKFHVGLLWTDNIAPTGGWGAYAGTNMWHSEAKLHFDVGARTPVQHAAYHAPPFGRFRRADEAERVLSTMTRPDNRPPGLIAADWNGVSADRVFRPGWSNEIGGESDRWVLYDPDPYVGKSKRWHGDLVYQAKWEYDDTGQRRWQADREPGEVLYAGGLRDVAAALDAPWQTTVGHWPEGDPYGERRIDAIRVTEEIVPALRGYEVINTELTRSASDHLPIVAVYDVDAIAA
uniref:hypothetical protein n=1 Tax=Amycolatopsis sp. CA-096443 TaxID=3239919 RepID=UPI003F498B93